MVLYDLICLAHMFQPLTIPCSHAARYAWARVNEWHGLIVLAVCSSSSICIWLTFSSSLFWTNFSKIQLIITSDNFCPIFPRHILKIFFDDIDMHTYMCVCTRIYEHVCVYVYMYKCVYLLLYTYVCICICIIYICIFQICSYSKCLWIINFYLTFSAAYLKCSEKVILGGKVPGQGSFLFHTAMFMDSQNG